MDPGIFYAVQFFGGPMDGMPAAVQSNTGDLMWPSDVKQFRLVDRRQFGDDLILIFEVIKTGSMVVYASSPRGFRYCRVLSEEVCVGK